MTFEEKKETERVLKEFVNTFADFKKLNKEQLDYMLLLFDKYDIEAKLADINKRIVYPKNTKKKSKKDIKEW